MNLGDQITKQLTTGRLYWLPRGATDGFIDFGNVADYKHDPKIERAEHLASAKGRRQADLSLVKSANLKKSFTFDEYFIATIALLIIGLQGANAVQGESDSTEAGLDDVAAGRVYDLGKQGVTGLSVADDHDTRVPASAYSLDAATGILTILDTADTGANPAPWAATFACPALTSLAFTAFNNLLAQGTFLLHEFDQFDDVPRAVEQFNGQCYVTAWPDAKGDKFEEFTLEVLITP